MPFKLPSVAELEVQYTIKNVPGYVTDDEDSWIRVSFRQATEAETLKRESFAQNPYKREWRSDEDSATPTVYAETVDNYKPLGERWAFDVYLTLTSCDIFDRDDTPLFTFISTSDGMTVVGTFPEFLKAWGKLPTPVANALHARCYEANPDWSPRSPAEAEKEELEGEE